MYALGLGANAALFTVMDRVFFQAPLGVVEPTAVRRLVQFSHGPGDGVYASDDLSTKDATNLSAAEVEGCDARGER